MEEKNGQLWLSLVELTPAQQRVTNLLLDAGELPSGFAASAKAREAIERIEAAVAQHKADCVALELDLNRAMSVREALLTWKL